MDGNCLMEGNYIEMNKQQLNSHYCKQIVLAQLSGKIVLPYALGLNNADYQVLIETLNDEKIKQKEAQWHQESAAYLRQRAEFCGEMFAMKQAECDDLITLLNHHRDPQVPLSQAMAVIVATACLTQFHLWESLGLSDRAQLATLLQYNFPSLHALNTHNMRWKRFFYHQLCAQEGSYLCKAPSCEECKSYHECFA